jgi:hypothetical protein
LWVKPWSGQIKDYKTGIFCFSNKHAALTSKSKDWLSWKQINVSVAICLPTDCCFNEQINQKPNAGQMGEINQKPNAGQMGKQINIVSE